MGIGNGISTLKIRNILNNRMRIPKCEFSKDICTKVNKSYVKFLQNIKSIRVVPVHLFSNIESVNKYVIAS